MSHVQTPTILIIDERGQLVTPESTQPKSYRDEERDLLWEPVRDFSDWRAMDWSDPNYILDQFNEFRDVQMVSSEYRADALDGISIISAFLVALACNDLISLESDSFLSYILSY